MSFTHSPVSASRKLVSVHHDDPRLFIPVLLFAGNLNDHTIRCRFVLWHCGWSRAADWKRQLSANTKSKKGRGEGLGGVRLNERLHVSCPPSAPGRRHAVNWHLEPCGIFPFTWNLPSKTGGNTVREVLIKERNYSDHILIKGSKQQLVLFGSLFLSTCFNVSTTRLKSQKVASYRYHIDSDSQRSRFIFFYFFFPNSMIPSPGHCFRPCN